MKRVLFFIFILTASCCIEDNRRGGDITIMSWNVQNLFDGVDDGSEYSDFSVAKGLWSETLYKKRLQKISKIIKLNNPDIIGFQEIEGDVVLNDLKEYLRGYSFTATTHDRGAIQTGFLSKHPILNVGLITPSTTDYGTRSMLEVTFNIDGRELVIINNHWKSKRGDFSEHLRIDSSVSVKKRLIELKASEVILLGDFNENFDEYKRVGKSYPTALMYNESGDGLTITGGEVDSCDELYTPWAKSDDSGSYLFQSNWETIDHFLLNKKMMDKDNFYFIDFSVYKRDILFTESGNINKWITDFGIGYSDHLPIILTIGVDAVETTLE